MKRIHPRDVGLANPRYIGKDRVAVRASVPEAKTMAKVRAYCDNHGIEHFHIPGWLLSVFGMLRLANAFLEHARESADEVRGFPDLILFCKGRFFAIELKTEIGKMTTAQRTWQDRLDTKLCRDYESAISEIKTWHSECVK